MNDPNPEYVRPLEPAADRSSRVTIAVVVATLIVILACIVACTAIALVFLYNAPWG
ncbi:MAG TPA: hypothetical protein VGA03_06020 [Anaerolineales bacterium]|jgi:hypothetical protein